MKLGSLKLRFKHLLVILAFLYLILGLLSSNWIFMKAENSQKLDKILLQRNEKGNIYRNISYFSYNSQESSFKKPLLDLMHQRTFWVYEFSSASYSNVNATLLSIGDKCYVYMEDSCITELGEYFSVKKAEEICQEFDTMVYFPIIDLAGHPNGTLGDIDGDPRIIILVSQNPYSYYDQRNELNLEFSNLCEMFHFNYQTWMPTLVHEFHHLIWFNNEMDEPHFTLEALAEYAMYHAGYLTQYQNKSPQTDLFLNHPEDSLLYWNMLNSIDYGGAYLFAFYIAEHYGVDILFNLISEPTDGAYGIENVLRGSGYNVTFNELYLNWITALTLDQLGFGNNLYGFENLNARVTKFNLIRDFDNIKLYYYGFNVHKVETPTNKLMIQVRKDLGKTIGLSIAFKDKSGWHVYQNLCNKESTIITANISGFEIDEIYIITSYILDQTPSCPSENGLGPFTYIEIVIGELSDNLILPAFTLMATLMSTIIFFIIIRKNHKKHKKN